MKTNYVRSLVKIKVVGIGGGDCNAITRTVRAQTSGVEFVAMNTDVQQLAIRKCRCELLLARNLRMVQGSALKIITALRNTILALLRRFGVSIIVTACAF